MENQKVVITVSDEKEKSKINELVESLGEKNDFIFATKNKSYLFSGLSVVYYNTTDNTKYYCIIT